MRLDAVLSGRRRRMSLTSLIDVIFLLLLFFMLTATFSRFGDIELTTGGSAEATETSRPVFVQLRGTGLTLNGEVILLDRLGDELAALNADRRADAVIVSVGEDATAQQLVDVMGTVNALGTLPLQIVR